MTINIEFQMADVTSSESAPGERSRHQAHEISCEHRILLTGSVLLTVCLLFEALGKSPPEVSRRLVLLAS